MRRTWLLAALGPLLVIGGLAGLGSVAAVFAAYHAGLCVALPALLARREGLRWRGHARRLGLTGPATRRGLALGAALGGVLALAAPAAFALAPGLFPAADRLRAVLLDWGADPARPAPLLIFLILVNGPAEELFWRGYLQDRLGASPRTTAGLVLLFLSYHAYTLGALAPSPVAAALLLGGVAAAAVFWSWSRRRWGSLWPAILSHAGATAGWAAVAWRLLA